MKIISKIKDIGVFLKIVKAYMRIKEDYMTNGMKTSEFWGKALVQVLTLIASFWPKLEIDPEKAFTIVAGIEAVYAISRGIAKGLKNDVPPTPIDLVTNKDG